MEDKRAARKRVQEARATRSAEQLADAGSALARHGRAAVGAARTVAAYASVRDEPPTRLLLDHLIASGVDVLLPRVAGDRLAWAPYRGWAQLVATGLGLLEPAADALDRPLDELVDVVLAPALAVDRAGTRLGRGGGYFDRALTGIAPVRILAVVFADEVLPALPVEAHDVPVGAALTPHGVVPLGQ